jgi:hypothetical protein
MVVRSNLVAFLALFIALSAGTAYATKHYLITSTKQIKPSVRRALHGSNGATGPTGNTGATGPLLTVLPSGKTETGTYQADGTATVVGALASTSISFPIPLASAPTPNIVPSGTTTACPGSVTAPSAAPGQLCVYEGGQANVAEIAAYNPFTGNGGGASPYGAGLVVDSAAAGNFYSDGTWAVTAP